MNLTPPTPEAAEPSAGADWSIVELDGSKQGTLDVLRSHGTECTVVVVMALLRRAVS